MLVTYLLKGMFLSTFVWMMLYGKFAICLFDLWSIGSLFHLTPKQQQKGKHTLLATL
jgi:hypothetical protein